MCTPALLGGAALSGGGAILNRMQQNDQIARTARAQNGVMDDEYARQAALRAEAQGQLSDAIGQQDSQKSFGDLVTRKLTNGQNLAAAVTTPVTGVSTPAGAPAIVKDEVTRKLNQATAAAKNRAENLGALDAWGQQNGAQGRALTRSAQGIGQVADAAAGQSRLLPIRLNAAINNSQRPASPFGDLLQLGGQGLTLYGLTAGGPSFGDLFDFGSAPGAVSRVGPYDHI